ncbi:MAG: ABC transporter ATP-binding protein [Myxococcota bacterium]|nr:ABC transporter ATP-binding protein [Myxococcota bacterium]
MTHAIHLRGVSKSYGNHTALDNLSFSVPRGSICGIIGANGAGKTTLYSIIGGYLPFDGGEIDILGDGPFDIKRHQGRVALLPQDSELHLDTPIHDILLYLARLQGMSKTRALQETDRVLQAVDLHERRTAHIDQLSHGMRRRVCVAQALLGNPELILLDEPTAGLDPHQTARLREVFFKKPKDSTLLISSHILSELEEVCDYVVFMKKGRCTEHGSLSKLTGKTSVVRIAYRGDLPLKELQDQFDDVQLSIKDEHLILRGLQGQSVAEMNRKILPVLLKEDIDLLEVHRGFRLFDKIKR